MSIVSIAVIVTAYALGCIAVGYYLVRWRTGKDLHEVASGATGGRNAGRVLGRGGAVLTVLADIVKGMIAVGIARTFQLEARTMILAMLAVVIGHIWPVQLRFKGGKGLSPAFGALVVFDYRVALAVTLIAVPLFFIGGRKMLYFLLGIGSCPLIAYLFSYEWDIVAGLTLMIAIIYYAHRDNIRTLLQARAEARR